MASSHRTDAEAELTDNLLAFFGEKTQNHITLKLLTKLQIYMLCIAYTM